MSAAQRVVTCVLGTHTLAIDVARVLEVLPSVPITPVPLAAPDVLGLVNLRGTLVTVLDPAQRLGLDRDAAGRGVHVVLSHAGAPISLLVDAVGDVVDLPVADVRPTPSTVPAALGDHTLGTFLTEGSLVVHLDIDHLLTGTTAMA